MRETKVVDTKKAALIDQLRSRVQVKQQMTIQVNGEPFPVRLPNTLQWASLSAVHPALADLIQFKDSAAAPRGDDEEMAANVVGLSMALQSATEREEADALKEGRAPVKSPQTTEEEIHEFVTVAADMNVNELEQGFLAIFFESHLTHKRVFLEAADRAAAAVESPVKTKKAPPKRKPKASANTATST